ncbi:TonB family protein [Rhodovulum euryhalinum]|uniref:energy transducer TonB family protein n=1 Tax=Rhodovulum euryhalinum TaxID=35805 RepID=UPI001051CD5D
MPMTALRPMPAPDALLATGSRSSLTFREPSPLAQRTALPRLAAPVPGNFDIEPPPSAPVRVTKRPESRPQPRSEAPETRHGERPRTARPTVLAPSRGSPVASGRSAAGPGAAKGDLSSLKARWGSEILARIQRRARGAPGREGIVALSLWVGRDGALLSASVARSSGNPRLDDMALRAVRSAGGFPPAPAALTEARYGFSLSIRFRR